MIKLQRRLYRYPEPKTHVWNSNYNYTENYNKPYFCCQPRLFIDQKKLELNCVN